MSTPATDEGYTGTGLRVLVVGSGTRFLSGISVYTIRLANALAERHHTSVVTLRRLLPDRLYPGRDRVGRDLAAISVAPGVDQFDGIDWFWVPSLPRALAFILRRRPQVLILQWWTGTVLHTYLALTLVARVTRVPVVIEFHEVLDTGEARMPAVRLYVRFVAPIVLRLASAFAVHSAFDHELLLRTYRLGRRRPIARVPHGLYEHYKRADDLAATAAREAPEGTTNLLFFGVIRPYKGLELLVRAFDSLPPEEISNLWLTVVGETWEGWTLPGELIAASPYRDRITFVNRYVTDAELDEYLQGADAVILPYLRSSISGPLHVAMSYGLPIVMTDVGGNAEAAEGYDGVTLVPPADEDRLREAIRGLGTAPGRTSARERTWRHTVDAYDDLFRDMGLIRGDSSSRAAVAPVETPS